MGHVELHAKGLLNRCTLLGDPLIEILYVITDLKVGGVPLHLRQLVLAMCKRGYRVCVVSLAHSGPVARMLTDDGVEVLSCEARGRWDFRYP